MFTELTENAAFVSEDGDSNDFSGSLYALTDNHLDVPKIQKAIQQLPDGYRVVFTLYAMEGYDHEEIGFILGVNEATSNYYPIRT